MLIFSLRFQSYVKLFEIAIILLFYGASGYGSLKLKCPHRMFCSMRAVIVACVTLLGANITYSYHRQLG